MSEIVDSNNATTAGEEPAGQGEVAGFAALGLSEAALRAIADLGYAAPTPVQEQVIPLLLAGRDVIAQAPTGTGKTAAYGLPIVERLDQDELRPQALIVVPTRELAIQVAEAIHALGRYREAVTLPIYGGQPYERQFRALARGVQIIAGTPGRLLDHLQRETLNLSAVHTVVLDEADEMLSMGFIEDIEAILAQLPAERQSALFSATIPPRIARLAERYMREPARISVAAREAIAPQVRQVYYEVPAHTKPDALSRILDLETPESAIVFVRTRNDADVLAETLNGHGYLAQAIHGEINQAQRERILDRFRNGHTQLLVATDVAARGLDIPDVSHIINYDLPMDAEGYVHRIGRTGRAGRTGEALTLVTPRERKQLRLIEQSIHRHLQRITLPTSADIAARRRQTFRDDVLRILDGGQLDPFIALVEDLADVHDPTQIAAAAFKMAAQARDTGRPGLLDAWLAPPAASATAPEQAPEPTAASGPPAGQRERRPVGAARGRRDGAMTRLFLRVGKRDGVRPADVVGAIANEAGVPGEAIGDIDLYDTFSFVEVPEDAADAVLAALDHTTIRGREPRASIARPPEELERDGTRPHAPDGRRGEREWRPRSPRERPSPVSAGMRPPFRVFGAGRKAPGGSAANWRKGPGGPAGARPRPGAGRKPPRDRS